MKRYIIVDNICQQCGTKFTCICDINSNRNVCRCIACLKKTPNIENIKKLVFQQYCRPNGCFFLLRSFLRGYAETIRSQLEDVKEGQ